MKKPRSKKRSRWTKIPLSVNAATLQLIKEAAAVDGKTVSRFIRDAAYVEARFTVSEMWAREADLNAAIAKNNASPGP